MQFLVNEVAKEVVSLQILRFFRQYQSTKVPFYVIRYCRYTWSWKVTMYLYKTSLSLAQEAHYYYAISNCVLYETSDEIDCFNSN